MNNSHPDTAISSKVLLITFKILVISIISAVLDSKLETVLSSEPLIYQSTICSTFMSNRVIFLVFFKCNQNKSKQNNVFVLICEKIFVKTLLVSSFQQKN